MRFEKNIKVKQGVAKKLQSLLDQEEVDFKIEGIDTDSTLLKETVKFENGYFVDIKVCSGQTNCWSEAVLFNQSGVEISVTEPASELLGEYIFSFKQDEYITNVEVE